MNERRSPSWALISRQSGFTLIEMLIVIIVLGILAMIIVPQITISTDDAKVSTLQSNVAGIRSAVEVYYVQHGNTYPGENNITGSATSVDGDAGLAFVQQLTRYSDSDGAISNTKTGSYTYGPYIKTGQLPANPYNDDTGVVADADITDIATDRAASDTGATGWMTFPAIGAVFANDGESSNSVEHSTY